MRSRFVVVAFVACVVFVGACNGCDPVDVVPPLPDDQIDVLPQKAAAKTDVLWVIDNSGSMAAEQQKLAARFGSFFQQLIVSGVDHHTAVVTTDPAEGGALRSFSGVVEGCDRCAVLDRGVSCDDVDGSCDAAVVFRDLVQPGTDGTSFEQGFAQAVLALDGRNPGFLRDDASLFVIFVSDEDEGSVDGEPVRRVQRELEALKGRGNENLVTVAAIAGWPVDNAPVGIDELCPVLATTFDADTSNDDARAAAAQETLRDGAGCVDAAADDGDESAFAEVGGRYLELACRTGGVVANLCDGDYDLALGALGVNAAGLVRRFSLSDPDAKGGADCEFFVDGFSDDVALDCDEDGFVDDAAGSVDGPLCVSARCAADVDGGVDGDVDGEVRALPRGVWEWEPATSSIRFGGGCVPAAGSDVIVRYARFSRPRLCQSP